MYGGNLAALVSSPLLLFIELSTPLAINTGVDCVSQGIPFTATYTQTQSRYTCTIQNQGQLVPKSVSVSLQYRIGDTVFSLTTTPVTVYFICASTLSFSVGSVNAAVFGSLISTTVQISPNNVNATLFTMDRVYNSTVYGTGRPNSLPSSSSAVFSAPCVTDFVMFSLSLDIGVNTIFLVNISLNELPISCIRVYHFQFSYI